MSKCSHRNRDSRLSSLTAIAASVAGFAASPAAAQFDPASGQWGKAVPSDIRVMTYNIGDGLFTTQPDKQANVQSKWNAFVRIVASLKPDVLILQEVGASNGADTVNNTGLVIDLFRNGGFDPFLGLQVTSFLTAFDPDYDLPYRHIIGSATDGFNRNVILSKYSIVDINGDGIASADDFSNRADLWAPGGGGEVRGFSWAEIDLPDETYAGDLVVGNSHLKAFGDCSSYNRRLNAASNISYFIEYYWNGAGTGVTDPRNAISFPSGGAVLPPNTPVIWGGDWNNNPSFNGASGCFTAFNPVDFLVQGDPFGTGNGPDRDGTDAMRDFATEPFTGTDATQSSSKLDYIGWQDSIATARNQFVFNSSLAPENLLPPIVLDYPRPRSVTGATSDHRPVIVDFILPLASADGPPVISFFFPSVTDAGYTDEITLTASVFDTGGSISGDVEFFADTNGSGNLNASIDVLLGTATPSDPAGTSEVSLIFTPADYLTSSEFASLVGSSETFFVRARDNDNQNTFTATTVAYVDNPPVIDMIAANP
ncbi:MAG: endonuclease/exonuclease/phosphatase family protein [Planctomycetota bacterium]